MEDRIRDLRSSLLRRLSREQKPNDQFAQALARQISTTGHEYKPLPQEGTTIRLLRLKSTWRSQGPRMLHFDFTEAKLRDKKGSTIAYYAISYTWGESPGLVPMMLNGQQVLIPASAEAALRGIVHQLGSSWRHVLRPIWIDAVCINQANLYEKQQQISNMGRIYSMAKIVFVWLGPDDGTAKRASYSFKLLAQQQQEFDAANMKFDVRKLQDVPSRIDRASLDSFFDCPWFTRLWTVQEVALSQQTIFVRGPVALDWRTFNRGIERIWEGPTPLPVTLATFIPAWELTGMRMYIQTNRPTKIGDVLQCALTHGTSNPWDKIYGLLGLLQEGSNVSTKGPRHARTGSLSEIMPDYSRPLVDVFREATWLAMDRELSTFLLSVGQDMAPLPEAHLSTWPSWVPRYHKSKGRLNRTLLGGDRASDGMGANYRLGARDDTVLKIQGVHVQTVRAERVRDLSQLDAVEQFVADLWNMPRDWQPQDLSHVSDVLPTLVHDNALSDFGAYLLACKSHTSARCTALVQAIKNIRGQEGSAHAFREALQDGISIQLDDFKSVSLVELSGFRFARTTRGLVKPGDQICIFFGMKEPVVLRAWGEHYKLRGLAFVPGIDNVQRLQDEGRLEEETVTFSIS